MDHCATSLVGEAHSQNPLTMGAARRVSEVVRVPKPCQPFRNAALVSDKAWLCVAASDVAHGADEAANYDAADLVPPSPQVDAEGVSALAEVEANEEASSSVRRSRSQSRCALSDEAATAQATRVPSASSVKQELKKLRSEHVSLCEQHTAVEAELAAKVDAYKKEHAQMVQMEVNLALKDAEIESLQDALTQAKANAQTSHRERQLECAARGLEAMKRQHVQVRDLSCLDFVCMHVWRYDVRRRPSHCVCVTHVLFG